MDQNTVDSREQWLKNQVKKRSEYIPQARKPARGEVDFVVPQTNPFIQSVTKQPIASSTEAPEYKNKSQISKPNPFPLNRQNRSRVIYRNLNQSVDDLISVNKQILKHGSIKAGK